VAAVQRTISAIYGYVETEEEGLLSGLMDGTVGAYPHICLEEAGVSPDELFKVAGSRFFLPFEEELEIC
jgi:hypothetical protein